MKKRSLKDKDASDDIWHHPFVQKVATNAIPTLREEYLRLIAKTEDTKTPRTISSYHREVFNYAGALCNIPHRLQTAQGFLETIPNKSQLDRLGLGRKDYIIYHYEKYIFLMAAAPDVALNLVNSVFNLGFPKHRRMTGVRSCILLFAIRCVSCSKSWLVLSE